MRFFYLSKEIYHSQLEAKTKQKKEPYIHVIARFAAR